MTKEFVQLIDGRDRVRFIPVEAFESFDKLHNKERCLIIGIVLMPDISKAPESYDTKVEEYESIAA